MRRFVEIAVPLVAFLVSAPWIVLAVLVAADVDSDCLTSSAADIGVAVSIGGGAAAALALLASFTRRSRHLMWPLVLVFAMLFAAWYVIATGCD